MSEKDSLLYHQARGLTDKIFETIAEELDIYTGKFIDDDLRQRIDKEYCQRIRMLSTEHLEVILSAHEKELYKRAPNTLEHIIDELATRTFLE